MMGSGTSSHAHLPSSMQKCRRCLGQRPGPEEGSGPAPVLTRHAEATSCSAPVWAGGVDVPGACAALGLVTPQSPDFLPAHVNYDRVNSSVLKNARLCDCFFNRLV